LPASSEERLVFGERPRQRRWRLAGRLGRIKLGDLSAPPGRPGGAGDAMKVGRIDDRFRRPVVSG
jgi:hypothetical protein